MVDLKKGNEAPGSITFLKLQGFRPKNYISQVKWKQATKNLKLNSQNG